jgi:hypothetical protein
MCISITVGHSGSGSSAIISYSATDGTRTLYGDQAFGWGGKGTPTDAELCVDTIPPQPINSNIIIIIVVGILIYLLYLRGK